MNDQLDDHASPELDYRAQFRLEGERITAIAAGNDLTRPVPSCPDWTLGQLIGHCSRIWAFVKASIEAGERIVLEDPTEDLAQTHAESHAAMADMFDAANDDDPCWTFAGDATMQFWLRRMAHEAALHRWDAENAISAEPTGIDPHLAVDGIDELFDFFVVARAPLAYAGDLATVHLHATDAHGEWMLTRSPDGIEVEHAHGKGDVAARGPASDLLLMMWNRLAVDQLEIFGDAGLLTEWQEKVRF